MASPVESRRPELRKDSVTNRWVIFSPARAKRPSDFQSKSPAPSSSDPPQTCPFCIGQEHHCAPEIFRFPPQNSDWKVRVIQNLYPALSRDKDLDSSASLCSDSLVWGCLLDGYGFHDVIIESPVHSVHLSDLIPEDVAQVLLAYKKRILQLAGDDSIKYVQVLVLLSPFFNFFLCIMLVSGDFKMIFHLVSSALCHFHFVEHVGCIKILNCYLVSFC